MKRYALWVLSIAILVNCAQAALKESEESDPLIIAVAHNDVATVKKIIKHHKSAVTKTGLHGHTALMCAVAPSLLSSQASAYKPENKGNPGLVELLLKHEAPINVKDTSIFGRTALMHAITSIQPDMVEILLRYDADPTILDKAGESVFTIMEDTRKKYTHNPDALEKLNKIKTLIDDQLIKISHTLSERLHKCESALNKAEAEIKELKHQLHGYEPGSH